MLKTRLTFSIKFMEKKELFSSPLYNKEKSGIFIKCLKMELGSSELQKRS